MHWIRPSRWSLACVVVVLVLILVAAVGSALTADAPRFTPIRPPSFGRHPRAAAHRRPAIDVPRRSTNVRRRSVPDALRRSTDVRRRSAPDALRRAVASTLAARTSRVVAHVSGPTTGLVIEIHGVTSFVEPLARFTTASGLATTTRTPPVTPGLAAMPTEVRVRGQTAWIRAGPDGPWTTIDTGSALGPVGQPSWADLFRSLAARPDRARWRSPANGRPTITTIVDGHQATVDLDRLGRIRGIRLEKGAGVVFELELSDLGTEVVVVPP